MPRKEAVVFVHGVGPVRPRWDGRPGSLDTAFFGPFLHRVRKGLDGDGVEVVPFEANWSADGFTFASPPGGPEYAEIDPDGPEARRLSEIEMVRVLVHRKLRVWAEECRRPDRPERGRGTRTSYASRDALDGLKEKIAARAMAFLIENMGDVWVYLRDPAGHAERIRAEVRAQLDEAWSSGAKRVHVVAHSLGTLVAYDVLREVVARGDGRRIATFLTMGSPLQNVRRLRIGRRLLGDREEPAVPGYGVLDGIVERWVNVYDVQDVVGEALVGEGFGLPASDVGRARPAARLNVVTESGDNPVSAHDQWGDEAVAGLAARWMRAA